MFSVLIITPTPCAHRTLYYTVIIKQSRASYSIYQIIFQCHSMVNAYSSTEYTTLLPNFINNIIMVKVIMLATGTSSL